MRLFRILIDFPSLDRLLVYLEADQQQEVDLMSTKVASLTVRLRASRARLAGAIEKETT